MNARVPLLTGVTMAVLAAALQAGAAVPRPAFRIIVVPGGEAVAEPSITVDHARPQHIYLSAPSGVAGGNSPAWVSTDSARSFTRLQPTSLGPETSRLGGGDTDVITDKAGNVYATDLWLGDDALAYSSDHGRTWFGSPVSHRPFDDRNWLAYSAMDDALYQIFDGMDGVWIARADGVSADPKQALVARTNLPVFTWATGANKGFNPPGRLTIDQRTGELYAVFAEGAHVLDVAHSVDKGQSWTITALPHSNGAFMLAQAAVDPAGNLAIAWSSRATASGAAYLSVSSDHGRTFHTTMVPTAGPSTFNVVTPLGRDRWASSWVEKTDTTWRIRYADIRGALTRKPSIRELTVDPLVFDKPVNPEDDRSMGDFISNTVTADGTYLLTYTAVIGGKNQTRVARLEHATR